MFSLLDRTNLQACVSSFLLDEHADFRRAQDALTKIQHKTISLFVTGSERWQMQEPRVVSRWLASVPLSDEFAARILADGSLSVNADLLHRIDAWATQLVGAFHHLMFDEGDKLLPWLAEIMSRLARIEDFHQHYATATTAGEVAFNRYLFVAMLYYIKQCLTESISGHMDSRHELSVLVAAERLELICNRLCKPSHLSMTMGCREVLKANSVQLVRAHGFSFNCIPPRTSSRLRAVGSAVLYLTVIVPLGKGVFALGRCGYDSWVTRRAVAKFDDGRNDNLVHNPMQLLSSPTGAGRPRSVSSTFSPRASALLDRRLQRRNSSGTSPVGRTIASPIARKPVAHAHYGTMQLGSPGLMPAAGIFSAGAGVGSPTTTSGARLVSPGAYRTAAVGKPQRKMGHNPTPSTGI